jgi:hypothetical protein
VGKIPAIYLTEGEDMIHKMNLQDKYFDFIKNGTKRIELRLNDEKRQQIKIGDLIEFSNGKDKFTAKVIGLLKYQDFKTLFNDFGIEILADRTMTKQELLDVLSEFYTPEKQEKFGVLGIRVEL